MQIAKDWEAAVSQLGRMVRSGIFCWMGLWGGYGGGGMVGVVGGCGMRVYGSCRLVAGMGGWFAVL